MLMDTGNVAKDIEGRASGGLIFGSWDKESDKKIRNVKESSGKTTKKKVNRNVDLQECGRLG